MMYDQTKSLLGFDMDYTLITLKEGFLRAIREVGHTLQERYLGKEIQIPSEERVHLSNRIHSTYDKFRHLYPSVDPRESKAIYDSIDYEAEALPEVIETLGTLSDKGHPMYNATTRPWKKLYQRLEQAQIPRDLFLFIVSTEGEEVQKPQHEVLTVLVDNELGKIRDRDETNLDLRRSCYMGDHPDDHILARRAQVIFQGKGPVGIAVSNGLFSREELLEFPEEYQKPEEGILGVPDRFVLNNLGELPLLLEELEKEGLV